MVKSKQTQSEQLLKLAENVYLFRTPEREYYGRFKVNDHYETWPLRSKSFRIYLSNLFYKKNKKPPCAQALQDAINTLEGKAQFESIVLPVFTRIARFEKKIYIFLGNERWEVIEIDSNGWRIIPYSSSPVFFRKPKGMLALPTPTPGGDINELARYINFNYADTWILIASWLIAAFNPEGPYPILIFIGEQGTAKSTIARILRALVDPFNASLRTLPKSERDLIIAARNSWVLSFDNISKIPAWLSDAFCRLSTGGGLSTRKLYADSEEILFDVKRPIILNGIVDLATRGDLVDRSIIVNLPKIPNNSRKLEADLLKDFDTTKPRIFGSILGVISGALKFVVMFSEASYFRMADFAHWIYGAEFVGLWKSGSFKSSYERNRESASITCLEAEPVAEAIKRFVVSRGQWEGTASELHEILGSMIDDDLRQSGLWPKNGQSLKRRLKRLVPNLRGIGIDIEFNEKKNPKTILLRKGDIAI